MTRFIGLLRARLSHIVERFEEGQARQGTAWDPARSTLGKKLRVFSFRLISAYEHQAGRRGRFWESIDGALSSPRLGRYRALRRERAVRIDQPLLLISQVQRSGGTLLSQLLDGHPQCFAHPYELKWNEPKWVWPEFEGDEPPLLALRSLDESWLAMQASRGFYTKSMQNTWDTAIPTARQPFLFDRRLELEIFLEEMKTAVPSSRRDILDAYFTAFFNAWLDYGGLLDGRKQWVTAFVPRLAQHPGSLERFFHDYPDGLLVTCVRDPFGWLSSARRHGMIGDEELEEALGPWLDSTRAAIDAKERYPSKVLVLLFGDLVRNVDATMKRICVAAGIEFDPILLTPTFNGRAMASNSGFVSADFVDERATDRSSVDLSPSVRADIERIAGPLYRAVSELVL